MEAMSLETLLEAAKYVEYQTEAKARGEEPHDYHTFSKLCSATKDGQYPSVVHVAPPKKIPSVSNSSQLPEEIKEKKRPGQLVLKDHASGHDHPGTGTREVHNKLEKNRRAHLKECFEALKKQLPNMDERKTSNLSILRGAIRFIQTLKRKERDYEHEMENLAREKISFQQRLSILKKDLSSQLDHNEENEENNSAPEDDNASTSTASECGALSDFDDNGPNDASTINSAGTSDFASSSSSSTASSVLVGPVSNASASSLALSKASISGVQMSASVKEPVTSNHHLVHDSRLQLDNKASVLSIPSSISAQMSHAEGGPQPTRVFSTSNLHTMAGIFASPHAMQVITQPSGIKVITAPNSIMASNHPSVQHISVNHHPHGQIHVLTPSSNASYISSAKPFCADSLVQVASGSAKGISRPHLVSPLALVSPQTMVELNHGKSSAHLTDLIGANSLNLSQKGGSVLAGTIVKGVSTANPSNMIATLHVSKPSHSQMIQTSLGPGIIAQAGSHLNNGTHSGVTANLKPIVTNSVRSLPHITGIAHVVSQSPMQTPVGQLVNPSNNISPLVGAVSVVSHTGAVHPQSLGKVLKSVNQLNPIPILQQQFLQQVSVGSGTNQPIVKPVVVVSMPNVVPNANISSLVSMGEQAARGSVTQK